MKRYWEMARARVDGLGLRERAMVFAAAAFVVIALISTMLLDPLLAKQKAKAAQVVQQQEKMKELHAQMQALFQSRQDEEHSPLRLRLAQLKQQAQEQDSYLQSMRERLVEPDKMASLLEQVLHQNGKLQLVSLKTLPPSPVMGEGDNAAGTAAKAGSGSRQIFKHGVQISVRGAYLDLLKYLATLESIPVQLSWGEVNFSVEKYPDAVLELTLYTMSLGEIWLAI